MYLATDTKEFFVCYEAGAWEDASPGIAALFASFSGKMVIDSDNLAILQDNTGSTMFIGTESNEGSLTTSTGWLTRKTFTMQTSGTFKFTTTWYATVGSSAGGFTCGTKWLLNGVEVSNDAAAGNAASHLHETEITVEAGDVVTLQVIYTSSTESRYIVTSNTGIAGNVAKVPVNSDKIATW